MEVHLPRNLGCPRSAAMGFTSLPIILAVCALSLIVGLNYLIICRMTLPS